MYTLSFAGDIDGDGGEDLLTQLMGSMREAEPAVYLVPSTPRAPD